MANFSISFSPNGGGPISPTSIPITAGFAIGQLPDPPRRQGYTLGRRFVGWYTRPMLGLPSTRITPDTIAPAHHVEAYARWELNVNTTRHWRELGVWMWWRSNDVPLPPFVVSSDLSDSWLPAMETGMNNWNNLNTPVNFLPNQATRNTVSAGVQRYSHLGEIESVRIWLPFTEDRFNITLNSDAIIQFARDRNIDDVYAIVTSVMAHELGHAVGLQDNPLPSNRNGSLMNQGRNRLDVRSPTQFDIESVEMIYDH